MIQDGAYFEFATIEWEYILTPGQRLVFRPLRPIDDAMYGKRA